MPAPHPPHSGVDLSCRHDAALRVAVDQVKDWQRTGHDPHALITALTSDDWTIVTALVMHQFLNMQISDPPPPCRTDEVTGATSHTTDRHYDPGVAAAGERRAA